MGMNRPAAKNIDAYISEFPPDVQEKLEKIRTTIQDAAPAATEAIKYHMPTFVLDGNLIHFAAFKSHIGVYPAPVDADLFKDELSRYDTSKNTLRFSLDEPIPYDLIARIVRYRLDKNRRKVETRAAAKKAAR